MSPQNVATKMKVRTIEGVHTVMMMEGIDRWADVRVILESGNGETATVAWPDDMGQPQVGEEFLVVVSPVHENEDNET